MLRRIVVVLAVAVTAMIGCRHKEDVSEGPKHVYLFVSSMRTGKVFPYIINQSNGTLTAGPTYIPTEHEKGSGGQVCMDIAFHSSGKFMYTATVDGVHAYRVDTTNGALSPIADRGYRPIMLAAVAVHPSGHFLYAGDDFGKITVMTIDEKKGSLKSTGIEAHYYDFQHLRVHPSGRFLYSNPRMGPGVVRFNINRENGALSNPKLIQLGGSARAFLIHPSGKFAYFLQGTYYSSVLAYAIDEQTGDLQKIGSYRAESNAGDQAIDPRGEFLYVANGASNNISAFRIGQSDGTLKPVEGSPFDAGANSQPALVAIDPSSNFLYLTTYNSHVLLGYQINHPSGGLTALGEAAPNMGDPETLAFTPQLGPVPAVIARAPEPKPARAEEPPRFVVTDANASDVEHLRDRDYRIRFAAAYRLASRGQETVDALPTLIRTMDDPDETVAAAATYSIGTAGRAAASAVPALTRALDDPRSVVRVQAARALKNIGIATPEVKSSLVRMATQNAPGSFERSGALEALGPIGSDKELQLLVDRFATGSYSEQRAASRALLEMGPRAAPATVRLSELLFSQNLVQRREAADILAKIGPAAGAAIPSLYGALEDPYIGQRAVAAILSIRQYQPPPPAPPQ